VRMEDDDYEEEDEEIVEEFSLGYLMGMFG